MNSPKNVTRSMLAGALSVGLLFAGSAMADDHKDKNKEAAREAQTEGRSDQPVDDTWITTKVKADLLASDGVSGTDIKVDTVNGVVHLTGSVGSQAEADRAIEKAKAIKGVTRVDSSKLTVAGR
ncbi:BON domain-containing protein [Pseudoxanthomonas mexicana]|uniref:BON domain-containing protein n=1 Tax=Pseudoxanthomonas mexicana TaxID=128785 RepID=UPI00398B73FD